MINIQQFKQELEKTINYFRDNLSNIRTGRATGALVENIQVVTYNGQATLKIIELATITNNGPQELLIIPFDQTVLHDIEKKLRESSIGFSVAVDGNQIRLKNPPLTEEQREKYAKVISQFAEEAREKIRKERDEVRKEVKTSFVEKEITEDQRYRSEEEIDKIAKNYSEQVEEVRQKKEQEIMTV